MSTTPTAFSWAVDNPEKITALVEDTKAFVTVIAEAAAAPVEQQQTAVREAFTAGRSKHRGPPGAPERPPGARRSPCPLDSFWDAESGGF